MNRQTKILNKKLSQQPNKQLVLAKQLLLGPKYSYGTYYENKKKNINDRWTSVNYILLINKWSNENHENCYEKKN